MLFPSFSRQQNRGCRHQRPATPTAGCFQPRLAGQSTGAAAGNSSSPEQALWKLTLKGQCPPSLLLPRMTKTGSGDCGGPSQVGFWWLRGGRGCPCCCPSIGQSPSLVSGSLTELAPSSGHQAWQPCEMEDSHPLTISTDKENGSESEGPGFASQPCNLWEIPSHT